MTDQARNSRRGRRKPHNARTYKYVSFHELLALTASEPRTALVGDEQIVMTREERLYRLTVDRALQGHAHDVTMLLRKMAKSRQIVEAFREETVMVISGNLGAV
jgi:hypothetical protein